MARPKWNVATPRNYGESGEKTFWVNVGSAWENTSGSGKHDVVIALDALPLPDEEGKVRMFLFPNDSRDGEKRERKSDFGSKGSKGNKSKGSTRGDPDDEIPF